MRHLALLAALLALAPAARAAAQLRYSGALRDSSGRALDGTYLLRFTVPGEGDKEAWSESRYVKAEGGRFSTVLGARKPLPDSALRGRAPVIAEPPAGLGWSVLPDGQVPAAAAPAPQAAAPAPPAQSPDPGDLRQLERELDQARRDREESKRRLEALERAVTAPVAAAAPASARLYVVQAGDTLRTVAKKTLGDERHWVLIYQANADRIQRAGELVAGQKLVVPAGPR